jgi:hypothetical protein
MVFDGNCRVCKGMESKYGTHIYKEMEGSTEISENELIRCNEETMVSIVIAQSRQGIIKTPMAEHRCEYSMVLHWQILILIGMQYSQWRPLTISNFIR